MEEVFLSYAREDEELASQFADVLSRSSFSVFWDRKIEPGDQFDKVLTSRLEAASAVVVLWTPAAVKSEWVREEAGFAREHSKLVPVSFDDTRPPLGFRRRQTTFLSASQLTDSPPSRDLLKVLNAVRRLVSPDDPSPNKDSAEPATREPILLRAKRVLCDFAMVLVFYFPPIGFACLVGVLIGAWLLFAPSEFEKHLTCYYWPHPLILDAAIRWTAVIASCVCIFKIVRNDLRVVRRRWHRGRLRALRRTMSRALVIKAILALVGLTAAIVGFRGQFRQSGYDLEFLQGVLGRLSTAVEDEVINRGEYRDGSRDLYDLVRHADEQWLRARLDLSLHAEWKYTRRLIASHLILERWDYYRSMQGVEKHTFREMSLIWGRHAYPSRAVFDHVDETLAVDPPREIESGDRSLILHKAVRRLRELSRIHRDRVRSKFKDELQREADANVIRSSPSASSADLKKVEGWLLPALESYELSEDAAVVKWMATLRARIASGQLLERVWRGGHIPDDELARMLPAFAVAARAFKRVGDWIRVDDVGLVRLVGCLPSRVVHEKGKVSMNCIKLGDSRFAYLSGEIEVAQFREFVASGQVTDLEQSGRESLFRGVIVHVDEGTFVDDVYQEPTSGEMFRIPVSVVDGEDKIAWSSSVRWDRTESQKKGDEDPIDHLSWSDVQRYCKWMDVSVPSVEQLRISATQLGAPVWCLSEQGGPLCVHQGRGIVFRKAGKCSVGNLKEVEHQILRSHPLRPDYVGCAVFLRVMTNVVQAGE